MNLKGASPEALGPWVARYVNQLKDGRRDLAADLRVLSGSCRTSRTARSYQSAILALLADEDISLSPGRARSLRRARGTPRPVTRTDALTHGQFLRIQEHLDTRGRAILYMLASSGARPREVLALRLEDLDLESRPARFRIRGRDPGDSRVAFLSREAAGAVRVYLMVRDRFLANAKARGGRADTGLLFPLGIRAFEQIWALAVEKARLARVDRVTGRRTITPHAARMFFAAQMGKVLTEPVVEEMMGHSWHPGRSSGRYTEEELARAYLEGEKTVLLHRVPSRDRFEKRVTDLEKAVRALQASLREKEEEISHLKKTRGMGLSGGRRGRR